MTPPVRRCHSSCYQDGKAELIKQFLSDAIRKLAKKSELRSYEIPRGLLIESEPFPQSNGLLSDHGKPLPTAPGVHTVVR